MSPIMSSISRKISQVSRFPAKSPDSRRNKFVFLPKQPSRFEAYLWPDVIWVACVAWRPAASPLVRARLDKTAMLCRLSSGWKTVAQKKVLNSAWETWNAARTQRKTRKRLKVSFKAIFNAHFINLVSKEYFSYNALYFLAVWIILN